MPPKKDPRKLKWEKATKGWDILIAKYADPEVKERHPDYRPLGAASGENFCFSVPNDSHGINGGFEKDLRGDNDAYQGRLGSTI